MKTASEFALVMWGKRSDGITADGEPASCVSGVCNTGRDAGDRLLLFTDGVTEAANAGEVEFGSSRIVDSAGAAETSADETKSRVMQEVAKFCGGDFHDDVTLVVGGIR